MRDLMRGLGSHLQGRLGPRSPGGLGQKGESCAWDVGRGLVSGLRGVEVLGWEDRALVVTREAGHTTLWDLVKPQARGVKNGDRVGGTK